MYISYSQVPIPSPSREREAAPTREFKLEAVRLDQGARRVLYAGFAGLGRACVAVARLGEEVRRRDEARADVFDYIERFYNPKRRLCVPKIRFGIDGGERQDKLAT
jgi:hypothetical protein